MLMKNSILDKIKKYLLIESPEQTSKNTLSADIMKSIKDIKDELANIRSMLDKIKKNK